MDQPIFPSELVPDLVLRHLFADSLFVGREPFPSSAEAGKRWLDFRAHVVNLSLVCSTWKQATEKEALRNLPIIWNRRLGLERRLLESSTNDLPRPTEGIRLYIEACPTSSGLSFWEIVTDERGQLLPKFVERLRRIITLSNGPPTALVVRCRGLHDHNLMGEIAHLLPSLPKLTMLGSATRQAASVATDRCSLGRLLATNGIFDADEDAPIALPPKFELLDDDKGTVAGFENCLYISEEFISARSLASMTDLAVEMRFGFKPMHRDFEALEVMLSEIHRCCKSLTKLELRFRLQEEATQAAQFSQLYGLWPPSLRELRLVGSPWLPHLMTNPMPELRTVTLIDPRIEEMSLRRLSTSRAVTRDWREIPDQLQPMTAFRIAWVRTFLANCPGVSALRELNLGINWQALPGKEWPLQGVMTVANFRRITIKTVTDPLAGTIVLNPNSTGSWFMRERVRETLG